MTQPLTDALLERVAEDYTRRSGHDRTRLEQMIVYAQTARCRWKTLLEGLDEPAEWSSCGLCDTCTGDSIRAEGIAAGAASARS